MANIGQFIDTEDYEDYASGGDFSPLPAGIYEAIITDSVMMETKKGDGQYLKLTYEIVGDDYKGRLVWDNLNLVNPSEKAVAIGKRKLIQLSQDLGLSVVPRESSQLHDKVLRIKVDIEEREGYDPQNRVVTTLPYSSTEPKQVELPKAKPKAQPVPAKAEEMADSGAEEGGDAPSSAPAKKKPWER